MRSLAVALLLCLPLAAADTSWLAAMVRQFSSNLADRRDAASQAVRAHLEEQLAPLLRAMRDDDPEVARRAREAVAGLLPTPPEEADEVEDGGRPPLVFGRPGQGQVRVVFRRGRNGAWVVEQREAGDHARLIKLGLRGAALTDPLVRAQLRLPVGRGFAVRDVTRGGLAEKFGLRAHDVLLEIDGRRVLDADDVAQALGAMDRADLEAVVLRLGRPVSVTWPAADGK